MRQRIERLTAEIRKQEREFVSTVNSLTQQVLVGADTPVASLKDLVERLQRQLEQLRDERSKAQERSEATRLIAEQESRVR